MIIKRKLYSVTDEIKEKSSSFIKREKEFSRPFLGRRPLINSPIRRTKVGPGFMGSNVQRPKVAPKLDNSTVSKPPVVDANSRLKSLDETINYNLGGNNKSKSNWGNKFKTGAKTTVSGIGNTLATTGLGLGTGVAISMASSGGGNDD